MTTTMLAAKLATLGFEPEAARGTACRRGWFVAKHVRVVLREEEGVEVYAFARALRGGAPIENPVAHGILEWDATFSHGTPAAVVLAAIAKALET